jgi:hypothetical protein
MTKPDFLRGRHIFFIRIWGFIYQNLPAFKRPLFKTSVTEQRGKNFNVLMVFIDTSLKGQQDRSACQPAVIGEKTESCPPDDKVKQVKGEKAGNRGSRKSQGIGEPFTRCNG